MKFKFMAIWVLGGLDGIERPRDLQSLALTNCPSLWPTEPRTEPRFHVRLKSDYVGTSIPERGKQARKGENVGHASDLCVPFKKVRRNPGREVLWSGALTLRVAACCSAMGGDVSSVAACCSVLQPESVWGRKSFSVVVRCSMLQRDAACCRVLRCFLGAGWFLVAACSSVGGVGVWILIAVCCSVL